MREIVGKHYFVESGARFVRSLPTLQAAKDGAMRRCACGLDWNGHTKENLVDGEGKFVFATPEREAYDYDLGERPHPVVCGKAADSWLVRVCEVPTFGSLLSIDSLVEEGGPH